MIISELQELLGEIKSITGDIQVAVPKDIFGESVPYPIVRIEVGLDSAQRKTADLILGDTWL